MRATADKGSLARSDVYSIGSVLYEMLTGNPPRDLAKVNSVLTRYRTSC